MPTVRNRTKRPVGLSNGRILAPGEQATITLADHDQELVDTFQLAVIDPAAPGDPAGPMVGYVQVDRAAATDGEVLFVDSSKPGGFDARALPAGDGGGLTGQNTYAGDRTLTTADLNKRLKFTAPATLTLANVGSPGNRFEVYAQGGPVTISSGTSEVVAQGGVALVVLDDTNSWVITDLGGGAPDGGPHVIQDEGSPLAARARLNFVGAGVTVTDDAANDRTEVSIPGGDGGSGGPALLAYREYAPGTAAVYSTSSTSWADMDAVNLILPTFAAPASGAVLVVLTAFCRAGGAGNNFLQWGLRTGTTMITGSEQRVLNQTVSGQGARVVSRFRLTGLTGTVPQWKWAHRMEPTAGVGETLALAGTSTAIMEVWSA